MQIRRQNEPKERTNLETSKLLTALLVNVNVHTSALGDSTTTQFGPNTVKKIEADAGYDGIHVLRLRANF